MRILRLGCRADARNRRHSKAEVQFSCRSFANCATTQLLHGSDLDFNTSPNCATIRLNREKFPGKFLIIDFCYAENIELVETNRLMLYVIGTIFDSF